MLTTGQRIGSYVVGEQLGSGGIGTVFLGTHFQRPNERVAIKLLHAQLAEQPEIAARFRREEAAIRAIDHQNVVKVFEYAQLLDSHAYIVMEYVPGVPLRAYMRQYPGERLPPLIACRIFAQIADGLAAAHQKDIVHRDLKPNNVMVVPDPSQAGGGIAKILDFGIAKAGGPDFTHIPTEDGQIVMGTPAYMAPEQFIRPSKVDGRADVYSLGVMLYLGLSGHLPFIVASSANAVQECFQYYDLHQSGQPEPLATDTPAALVQLTQKMLAKRPEERPAMTDLVRTFREITAQLDRRLAPANSRAAAVEAPTVQIALQERTRLQSMKKLHLVKAPIVLFFVGLTTCLAIWAIIVTVLLIRQH